MANLPTLNPAVAIVDPRTGKPTPDFLQWWNALVKRLNSLS